MKSLHCALLGAVLLCLVVPLHVHAESPPGSDVGELLDYARSHNPELDARRLNADAAAERVDPAGALADPLLRMELMDVTRGGRSNPTLLPGVAGSTKYTLVQPLPFWGKRDLKRESAAAEAAALRGGADETWNDLAARIKTAYAQHYALTRQFDLTRQNLDLVTRLETVARARYAEGLVPQQDALRMQGERTQLQGELIALEMDLHHSQARLHGLLARPPHAPLATPQRLRPQPAPAQLDYGRLEGRLRERNPQLFAEAERIRAAEKNRDLAYRNRYPDLALGISPQQAGGRIAEWGVMLEITIPLQQESRRSQEREAELNVSAAQARRQAAVNQLQSELAESLSALDAGQRTETLLRDGLLPQAELGYTSALAAYETGKADFALLLDAQRQIRRTKQDLLKVQAEQQARLADIERLIGENL